MKYSTIPSAQTVVRHCKARGIQNVVISPGSRNAPLTIGFTEDPYFKCFSIVDERCAAFFGLGIAQFLQEPVALLCTSGSALLNYYPAVAEAFYSRIPLLVISADRPVYKIDIGDGQTIRQDNVFHRHIGYSANLRQDVSHATEVIKKLAPDLVLNGSTNQTQEGIQLYNDQELNRAIGLARSNKTPIHINVPMEEPLYDFLETPSIEPQVKLKGDMASGNVPELSELASSWNKSPRKMVLVGVNYPDTLSKEVLEYLAQDPSVVVFTETTSNLYHSGFFPSIDTIVAPIEKTDERHSFFKALQPDILLTFGGLIVSKKIKAFLREYAPRQHWHVDGLKAYDTFFSLSEHIKMEPDGFLAALRSSITDRNPSSNYRSYWQKIRERLSEVSKEYLSKLPFSDMVAFDLIRQKVPEQYQLHLANSSTVRYAQLFSWQPSIKMFCNRGTSGIDGSTSTAIGSSIYAPLPTLLITGDLSFFYDSNALWNNYIRKDMRIILINNGGGGIFRILPGKEDTSNFETYFETTQQLDAKHLCEMHNFGYARATEAVELEDSLKGFFNSSDRPQLLEVATPRLLNDKILLGYFDFLSSVFINH